jgi:hypothetical protein
MHPRQLLTSKIPAHRWVRRSLAIILWMFSPIVILSIFGWDNLWAMVASILFLHISLITFFFYAALFLKTNFLAPWPWPPPKTWKPKTSDIILDRLLRGLILVAAITFLLRYGPTFCTDVYDWAYHSTLPNGIYTVEDKYIPGSARAPSYYFTVRLRELEHQEFVLFFHSPRAVQVGRKYHFDLFIRSGIIVRMREAL